VEDDDVLPLARQLRPRLMRIGQAMRRDNQELSVTSAQGAVLSMLRGGPLGVGELARAEGVRPPSMTQLINRMEQLGWVTRTGPAVRGSQTELTDLGRAVAADINQRRVELIAQRLRSLGPAELAALDAVLPVFDELFGKPANP
jgi:DNA-binding MarR family transcriptional regulator